MIRLSIAFIFLMFFPTVTANCAEQKEAEVIHWWVSGGEGAALDVVKEGFRQRGYRWIDTAVENSFQAKTAAVSRILDGFPPAMVQWHAGVSLLELYREGLLGDIDQLAREQGWQEVVPKVLWDNITVDGRMVAVPVTLHGANWIWANVEVLDRAGVQMPENWEDFLTVAEQVKRAGFIPLAIGDQAWQVRVLFVNLVLGLGGPDLYRATIVEHQPEKLGGEEIMRVFGYLRRLQKYIDGESANRSWADTTRLIIEGKAAFQIMGDWAKGEFFHAGMKPQKDFLCSLSPGSENGYLIVSDVFALSRVENETARQTQLQLARVMMDTTIQKEFNLRKGSIPPRIDVSTEGFDHCGQLAMNTLAAEKTEVLPGFNMANRGPVASAIMAAVYDFWQISSMTEEQAADNLKKGVAEALP